MASLNKRANLKAGGRLGSYLPVSMAFTVWRETSSMYYVPFQKLESLRQENWRPAEAGRQTTTQLCAGR
jgi:hypothetical protein